MLAEAAAALDDRSALEIIRVALASDATVATWEDLLVPVLTGVGEQHARTGGAVEDEHILSACVTAALTELRAGLARPDPHRPVLLACAEEEQHALPLHALAAALAEQGVAARMLGARVPYRALATAIRRSAPAAVLVWSQTRATGDPAPLAGLPGERSGPRYLVGGPGWQGPRIPGVRRVRYLPEAVNAVAGALGQG